MRRAIAGLLLLLLTLPAGVASADVPDLCARTATALTAASLGTSTAQDVKNAVGLLGDVESSPEAQAVCGQRLRQLAEDGTRAAAGARAFTVLVDADTTEAQAAADVLVLDPDSTRALALDATAKRVGCDLADLYLRQGKWSQARRLLDDLASSGDDATAKCAKSERTKLANLTSHGSAFNRTQDYLRELAGPTALVATIVFTVLLVMRAVRSAFPPSPTALARLRRARGAIALASLAMGLLAAGSLADACSEKVWEDPEYFAGAGWIGAALVLVAVVLVCIGRRAARDLAWMGFLAGGFLLTLALPHPDQWWLVPAALAGLGVGYWASGSLRITISKLEGTGVPEGFGAAIAAEFSALTERPPGEVRIATNVPDKAPEVSLAGVPGSALLTNLLAIWRSITPSTDLVVSGAVTSDGEKAQRLNLNLSRGRGWSRATTVSSRLFWTDQAVPTAVEEGTASMDLATGAAAWLLLEVLAMTDEVGTAGLNGATRWQSIALTFTARRRRGKDADKAALALLERAVGGDPENLAAKYSLLVARSAELDARTDTAADDYARMARALDALLSGT